jgi:hypothetical protein
MPGIGIIREPGRWPHGIMPVLSHRRNQHPAMEPNQGTNEGTLPATSSNRTEKFTRLFPETWSRLPSNFFSCRTSQQFSRVARCLPVRFSVRRQLNGILEVR